MKLFSAVSFLTLASVSAFAPVSSRSSGSETALSMSGVPRNPNFAKLAGGYLFPEIGRRRNAYLAENPDMADRIISLGIGDTTQVIPEHILGGLVGAASKLGTKEGYSGYGAEQGMGDLRSKIAEKLYNGIIKDSEVFVSDGAKCDIMRVQQMFGPGVVTAVQVRVLFTQLPGPFSTCRLNVYVIFLFSCSCPNITRSSRTRHILFTLIPLS